MNHGYDDARGDYVAVVADHLAYRYEVIGMLGRGSFGQVMKCRDHTDGSTVAIKIIRNKARFHTQALVEVQILDHLRSKVRPARHLPPHSLHLLAGYQPPDITEPCTCFGWAP